MTNQGTPSTAGFATRFGVLFGLAGLFFSIFLIEFNLDNSVLSLIGYVIFIGGMVYAMLQYKQNTQSYMSYSQGVGLGAMYSAVSGLINGLLFSFYIRFINVKFVEKMLNDIKIKLEEQDQLYDKQIESTLEIYSSLMQPGFFFLTTFIGTLLGGVIIALIVSAFMYKERSVFDN
ncbi:MAG TPA: hypothetical protein DCM08_02085 [Microscillaceae bacterium]|nr:hypothetical protein [Microscillaceae bacterium]